jgi:hypothetical protein
VSAFLETRRVLFICSPAPRRGTAHLRAIGKTLFIRYVDDAPEVVIASALADAERRGLNEICLFLRYVADPELLCRLFEHPRISSVGMKDRASESLLPQELKDDRNKRSRSRREVMGADARRMGVRGRSSVRPILASVSGVAAGDGRPVAEADQTGVPADLVLCRPG